MLRLVEKLEEAPSFDEFWKSWPKRVAKQDALKAWIKLTASERVQALEALPAHKASWLDRDPRYIPHAATWLNGKRFEDELEMEVADYCRWPGCTKRAASKYCDQHTHALRRGETPCSR